MRISLLTMVADKASPSSLSRLAVSALIFSASAIASSLGLRISASRISANCSSSVSLSLKASSYFVPRALASATSAL